MATPTNQFAGALSRFGDKFHRLLTSLRVRLEAARRGSIISSGAMVNVERGASIRIGRGVRVRPDAILNIAEDGVLELEDGAWIGPGVVIYCAQSIRIGAGTRVAHYVSIVDHDYAFRDTGVLDARRTKAPIHVGANVWLGASVIVTKGVTIGEGSVVAAGTVVTKSIPPRSVAHNPKPLVVRPIDTAPPGAAATQPR